MNISLFGFDGGAYGKNNRDRIAGFSEDEVFAALDECGFADEKEQIKRWYPGEWVFKGGLS